jgi:hypothetical protein
MSSSDGRYWSVQECGWVASPCAGDALATPWSSHVLAPLDVPHPQDADDLLRTRKGGEMPGQRSAAKERAPVRR